MSWRELWGRSHPTGYRYTQSQTPMRIGDHVTYLGGNPAFQPLNWQVIGFAQRDDGRVQIQEIGNPAQVQIVAAGYLGLVASAIGGEAA